MASGTRGRLAGAHGFSLMEMVIICGLVATVAAIAVPSFGNALSYLRVSGDARNVSNALALAKLDAASQFTRTRVYVDLSAKSHHLERLNGSNWQVNGGTTYLSSGVSFGYSPVTTPPNNTQVTIGQGCTVATNCTAKCLDNLNNPIDNTACVIFNSRGTPIDASGNPMAVDALYVSNGSSVYCVSISATGMIKMWQTSATSTPTWALQ